MKILFRCLTIWAIGLAAVRAEENVRISAAGNPGLDFNVFTSIQYAHSDIFYHTPSDQPPVLALTTEIAPGQRLDLVVIVRGFAVDAAGQADVVYDLEILNPDGKKNFARDVVVSEKKKTDPRALLFPKGVVGFKTDPGNPSGDYVFQVTVRDRVSGHAATKKTTVKVSETDAPLPLPDGLDASRLIGDYYQHPRPRLVLPAVIAFSRTRLAERKADGQGALLGFCEQVLADNPWLLPQFKARLATASVDERRLLALVLAFATRSQRTWGEDLPAEAKTALAAARKEGLPVPSLEPLNGGQIDVLWGRFLASGRFSPVAEIVSVGERYLPYRGKLDEFKKLTPKPPSAPPEVYKDMVLGAVLWSLGSNAKQHPLVRNYLLGLRQAEGTSPAAKALLQMALEWKPR